MPVLDLNVMRLGGVRAAAPAATCPPPWCSTRRSSWPSGSPPTTRDDSSTVCWRRSPPMSVRRSERGRRRYCFGVAVPTPGTRVQRVGTGPVHDPVRDPVRDPAHTEVTSGVDTHFDRTASERPARPALGELLRRPSPATWTVVLLVAAYTAYFTDRTLDIHHGLGTSSYDSALYDQGMWLMSRFHAPFVTLMGRNLMGDHTSFILVLLVPIYWVVPSAGAMFFVQSLAIGSARDPDLPLARRRLSSEWMGVVDGRGLPAAPGGVVDQHGELPSRRVPRCVRGVRDLWRSRAQVAAVRGVRGAGAAGQGRRVTRVGAARRVGGDQA